MTAAASKLGVSTGKRAYGAVSARMISELGLDAAFDAAVRVFVQAVRRDRAAAQAFEIAVREGRGPQRDQQDEALEALFGWSGKPTVLGAAVLARAKRFANEPVARAKEPRARQGSLGSGEPALPINRESVLPYLALDRATPELIEQRVLPHAPSYGRTEFQRLVENTIGAIHQIPRLYRAESGRRIELKQIEAYFGRSSGDGRNVYQRWTAGRERGHAYGIVFARCAVDATLAYERHGILLLDVLREAGGLCISNRSMKAVGKVGASEPGFLYMTFRILDALGDGGPGRQLSRDTIRELVRTKTEELRAIGEGEDVRVKGLRSALEWGLERANDTTHRGEHKLAHHGD